MANGMVRIPCPHDHDNNNFPPSTRKLEVIITHQTHERSIFRQRHIDGNYQTIAITPYRPCGPLVSKHCNPFCTHCGPEIINFLMSIDDTDDEDTSARALHNLKNRVENKIRQLHLHDDQGQDCKPHVEELNSYKNNEYIYSAEESTGEEEFEVVTGPTPATKEAIEALERLVIEDEGSTTSTTTCAICLEDLKKDKEEKKMLKVKLTCKHEFHEGCIVQWLQKNNVCPLCRFELNTTD